MEICSARKTRSLVAENRPVITLIHVLRIVAARITSTPYADRLAASPSPANTDVYLDMISVDSPSFIVLCSMTISLGMLNTMFSKLFLNASATCGDTSYRLRSAATNILDEVSTVPKQYTRWMLQVSPPYTIISC